MTNPIEDVEENSEIHSIRRLSDLIKEEDFKYCPKYREHELTEHQITKLIDMGITEYVRRQDEEIGKLTKKGVKYILTLISAGIFLWLNSKGFIRLL